MSIVAFIVGIGLPTFSGWLLVRLCEGKTPVLFTIERWVAGGVLGTTLTMALMFVLHTTTGLPLDRLGFLGAELATAIVLGGLWYWKKPQSPSPVPASSPRWRFEWLLWILLGIAIIKVLAASVTFLLLTPTFLDDALDNWNLRGKVFFVDQALTLALPGEDPILSPKGVSSYPPAVPLLKASLASIAGEWNDPLINSVHVLWYGATTYLVYCAIRRRLARSWALLGAYAVLAMPLVTMHGTNPYADVFVAVHVFLAASYMFSAVGERDRDRKRTWFALLGIAIAALAFTKNEGIVLYLPPLLLIVGIGLLRDIRNRTTSLKEAIVLVLRLAIPFLIVALPWLIFKWSQGLTFGNAKPFTSLGWKWHDHVLSAVAINTFFEGNWLFLFPLLFVLLVWRWRAAFTRTLALTAFVGILYVGQMTIFLFTALAAEALMQTGYARGLVQLLPCFVLLTVLLLKDAADRHAEDLA